jgi:hypothetical protein
LASDAIKFSYSRLMRGEQASQIYRRDPKPSFGWLNSA